MKQTFAISIGGAAGQGVATPGDILFHIRAARMDLCFELTTHIMARLGDAVATTDEVSFTAVPANSPNDCWLIPSAWPSSGKASTAAMLNRKMVEIA